MCSLRASRGASTVVVVLVYAYDVRFCPDLCVKCSQVAGYKCNVPSFGFWYVCMGYKIKRDEQRRKGNIGDGVRVCIQQIHAVTGCVIHFSALRPSHTAHPRPLQRDNMAAGSYPWHDRRREHGGDRRRGLDHHDRGDGRPRALHLPADLRRGIYVFDDVVDGVRREVSRWFPHSLHHLMADVGASRSQSASGAIASTRLSNVIRA